MVKTGLFEKLKAEIQGELHLDKASRVRYATDASVYFEEPMGIVIPMNLHDVEVILRFSRSNKIPIIPRAAGTSLAGQVVGNGLVVDVSKYLNEIITLNTQEKWVRVQPGVILDELNRYLAKPNLFFGPEASTANRCMIGGMVGNNACGLHAVVYGTTRDHLLDVSGYLSDGSYVTFEPLTNDAFDLKCTGNSLENKIYRQLREILSDKINQQEIIENYPESRLIRRNNGYALDQLLYTDPFIKNGKLINVAKLIAGSEGTLMFITELKLNLVAIPAKEKALVCAHFSSVNSALQANIFALKHQVVAVELMDDIVLNASKGNLTQNQNRFFIQDNPKAILMIEMDDNSKEVLDVKVKALLNDLEQSKLSFHLPVLYGDDTKKAWNLRKAGLGIMANIPGDTKSITVIEDTAVHPDVLPEYIAEFSTIMDRYGEECVYHAHAGTGEIHLRPRLNLKLEADVQKFEALAWEIAKLVKKFKGSLSGEHGDGRLRGSFIPFMLGEKVYCLLKDLKSTWDPDCLFNPGKIIDSPPIKENLRVAIGPTKEINTYFNFSEKEGIVRATERCNGSGDCRKLHTAGGTMCPSYMATKDEQHVTRSRANVLRYFLVNSEKENPFDHEEIYQALDLCLSCKACKSECPSSVDVAKLKAEFLQHYYDANGVPFRTKVIANISMLNKFGSKFSGFTNLLFKNKFSSKFIKNAIGFAQGRSIPTIRTANFNSFANQNINRAKGSVYLFIDEFTRYNDSDIAIVTIRLLNKLGYSVNIINHLDSGRASLSKGLLKKAKKIVNENVTFLSPIISKDKPLIGIEPSAILSFRDEYPDLVDTDQIQSAKELAKNALLFEEFIAAEMDKGIIKQDVFTEGENQIKLHGHCQQKAIASTKDLIKVLGFPINYTVEEIASGCCGMAGSFGYEKEHYDVSMKIGELVLFPEVRESKEHTISASGTSCRHQIFDGTGTQALHPAEILWNALK